MKKIRSKSYLFIFVTCAVLMIAILNSSIVAASSQASIEERIQRIERIIENPVLLQLSRRLGDQQREIQVLQDQIDFLKRDLRKMNATLDKRYKETDDRLSVLETAMQSLQAKTEQTFNVSSNEDSLSEESLMEASENTPLPEKKIEGMESDSLVPIVTYPATDKENDVYHIAFELIKKAQYDEAITAFQAFSDQYPQSELASNAYYWMGEAFYIKQDYQAALNAFNMVVQRYPASSKVADAMLRAGDCLDNLKQLKKAKNLYASLIALHPKTRAAEKAIKRLAKLQ